MKFYLELTNGERTFRMQSNKKSWKEIFSRELLPGDFITTDPYDIIKLQKKKWWKINAYGALVAEKPKYMFSSMELSQRLYYRVFVLREALPFLPVREQLESIIRYGNDRADNAVVLTIDGLFELRSCPFTVHDPFIVASFEKFPATGGFIGEEAAKDKKYLDSIYWKAVEFWVRHSITGETNFFSDEFGCEGQNPLYALFA